MSTHRSFYFQNLLYSEFLDTQRTEDFQKYTDCILKFTKSQDKVLDTGCGTGIALQVLKYHGRQLYGVEVSTSSVERCFERHLNCQLYDGSKIPFEDDFFDLVGSYNVLEHTDDPKLFLNENLRALKKGGHLIVVCPNFLSVTNSYHHHTRGVVQKMRNFISIMQKLVTREAKFEKMETLERENFQPDDDACNVTNPLDVLKWAKNHHLELKYWSSQPIYKKGIISRLDCSFLRLFLGGLFMVFRKL